jgi:hypothetical protein
MEMEGGGEDGVLVGRYANMQMQICNKVFRKKTEEKKELATMSTPKYHTGSL